MKQMQLTSDISIRRTVAEDNAEQLASVKEIIRNVRMNGDAALLEYTEKWDGVKLETIRVGPDEMKEAVDRFEPQLLQDLSEAAGNIRDYHENQKQQGYKNIKDDGSYVAQRVTAIGSAGLYVPGGTAAYPSSVLMNVIPAQVAGVGRIVLISPPGKDGKLSDGVLAAAHILGIEEVYKAGGAQAIAALAYGTESIQAVDKITGPGNVFVALAKREVFGDVAIDMIAGPSEITVIADDTAFADEVAADLLSQAEHDPMATAVLLTTSQQLADAVSLEVERQLETLPRQAIAGKAIRDYGMIYIGKTMDDLIDAANELAPEHLEIMAADAEALSEKIQNAGAIFIGRYSSEPIGDYFAGTNHVLPTNSTARFSSALSVYDFVKRTSVVYYSEQAWQQNEAKIARLARLEGLEGHARAVESRAWKKENGR
ncbi:histidinol dehydrogenase [Planococcus glaciei]|uniref:Histidinol dehydrogenase n=1 Tax=Planococcus glaciei TaxID=459472 RepID=A0A7H8QD93_9BACL|nr:histidinol dehydrogenase [Planococcus glaciei]ETP68272.1 histidinol dehydrogenase [Planococcus glaciei CHR43]QDY46077.1 histidinol dehydrogenase [Planococcus glaciei]QKX51431.1 histidinol dehydrogenase [Planococcus glaciei]